MGRVRDLISYVIRPWAALGTERWITVGGNGAVDDDNNRNDSALNVGTYYACIRNIAEDTAKLPFTLLENDGKRRIKLDDDPLTHIFATSPNPRMTAYTFRSTMMHWAAGWGNAFAIKVYDGGGRIRQLNPVHPNRVLMRMTGAETWTYDVYNNDGSKTTFTPDKLFHFCGMSGEGLTGYSVLTLMQNTMKIAQVTQRFAANFFQNSARPGGVLETASVLKDEVRRNLAASWAEMYSGPMNAGKTAVLEAGVQYKAITMPMNDMQFLETRKFQKEEIASWFRMPLYKLQDIGRAQGWSTLDAQESDYVNSCLMPWTIRFEQEIRRQLMDGYADNIYPHHEFKGLLRGDLNARKSYYQTMRTIGVMTGNEIRALEDMDPSDDPLMDEVFIQGAMTTLENAATQKPSGGSATDSTTSDEPASDKGAKEGTDGQNT